MKTFRSIICLFAWMCFIPMQAQTVDREALYIYHTDGSYNIFFRAEVTAISLEMRDGMMHQVVYTGSKLYYFPISKIQSMSFVNPDDDTYRPQIDEGEDKPTFGKAINLGLPSGTKWASCNVGATKPEEYGGYYAWGETEEKEVYNWSTYIHCDGSSSTCHDLGSDISGTEYDVAHVKWGGNWRMPTHDEQVELLNNCTSEWTTLNGVEGRKFTSKINGNSIFLPAAGDRWIDDFYDAGGGLYWSSTLISNYPSGAYYLDFHSGRAYWGSDGRIYGFTVRPVR